MAKAPKLEARLICPGCGLEPEPDRQKSNRNWNVYDPDCRYCGEGLKLEVVDVRTRRGSSNGRAADS